MGRVAMDRHSDISKILTDIVEPLLESIASGQYQLEDATMDVGTHRTVFQISLQPTMLLKLDSYTSDPKLN